MTERKTRDAFKVLFNGQKKDLKALKSKIVSKPKFKEESKSSLFDHDFKKYKSNKSFTPYSKQKNKDVFKPYTLVQRSSVNSEEQKKADRNQVKEEKELKSPEKCHFDVTPKKSEKSLVLNLIKSDSKPNPLEVIGLDKDAVDPKYSIKDIELSKPSSKIKKDILQVHEMEILPLSLRQYVLTLYEKPHNLNSDMSEFPMADLRYAYIFRKDYDRLTQSLVNWETDILSACFYQSVKNNPLMAFLPYLRFDFSKTKFNLKDKNILNQLVSFDRNGTFGPCRGISRLERLKRAQNLLLVTPSHLKKILLSDQVQDIKGIIHSPSFI